MTKMNRQISVVMCSAALALVTLSSSAIAQQKTAKACQEEWRANKAANQANGVTEKAYVASCRGGAAPTSAAAPAPAPAPSAAAPGAASGQKTAKACQEEWRANKAANQSNGVTEKAYVATCRSGAAPTTTAAPAAAPATASTATAPGMASGQKTAKECREEWRANKAANQANGVTEKAYVATCRGAAPAATAAPAAPAPTATPATPAPTAAAPPTRQSPPPTAAAKPAPTAPANPVGANQFSAEAQAKARCPTDTVVWANLRSKIYHFSGTKNYGNTKSGAYMCERDTAAEGIRAAKNETHP
jgi:hypothetical protein